MKSSELSYYQRTGRIAMCLLGAILLTRLTSGYFSIVLLIMGIVYAVKKRYGEALTLFILFPFMVIMNSVLLPKPWVMVYMLRFGPLAIGLVLALVSSGRRGTHVLPYAFMIPYIVTAAVSSMNGYAPLISYMKLINFTFFLLAVWLGTRNLHHHSNDLQTVRCAILAFSCILVLGSLAVLPWPTIAYATSYEGGYDAYRGLDVEVSRAAYADNHAAMDLFSGITFHSQALGPLSGCVFAWVLSDMIFLERRFRWLHVVLLCCCLPILYLTRSRCALLVAIAGSTMVVFYAARRIRLPIKILTKVKSLVMLVCAIVIVVAIMAEINDHKMSRWIRKTDNVSNDTRSSSEALTASRQGLIQRMIDDFLRNPILGCGFQVDANSARIARMQGGVVLSAPIEKGILPLMVLGEGGVVGGVAFLIFLLGFVNVCAKKRFHVTIVLFGALFAVNLGEATFFSPGGPGGIEWCVCMIGGFTIDTILLYPKVWRLPDIVTAQIAE